MTRKKLANGLTQQQEDFCLAYADIGIGYKALVKAYPNSAKWTRASADSYVQKLLNNDLIMTRVAELNEQKTSALLNSTKLNQRKLLESALMILEDCQRTPSQYANAINVLKLLYAQQGMMPKDSPQVNVQVNNNTITAEVSDYLNL